MMEINPEYADAYYMRSITYNLEGKTDRAFEEFNLAAKRHPSLKNHKILVHIASELSKIGYLGGNEQVEK